MPEVKEVNPDLDLRLQQKLRSPPLVLIVKPFAKPLQIVLICRA